MKDVSWTISQNTGDNMACCSVPWTCPC